VTSPGCCRRPRRAPLLAAAALTALLGARSLCAQSLTGTTGLVAIPTAAMPPDGTLSLSVSLLDRGYHNQPSPDRRALVQSASLAFLPFVEVGLRLTRALGEPRQALGDRMVSVRVRLLDETARRPAVVAGGHDLVGTRRYHVLYVVASKEIESGTPLGDVGFHLGYGGDWLSLARGDRKQFDGVLGGVSAAPRPWLSLLAEYDAERVNAGVRLVLLRRVALLVAAQQPDGLSAGLSYTVRLE
jgi:hypothetical protein